MSLIIKLHGTSGSGKTTVARGLMELSVINVAPMYNYYTKKPEAYECYLPAVPTPLYVLGPYTANCGGMDGINDSEEQIRLLHEYAARGHVFYEGLLASEYYGRLGVASERYGDDHLFAFLDTPIETCISRVKARRMAKGNTKPLNEDNTRGRVKKINRLKERLEDEFQRETCSISYLHPVQDVYSMYVNWERT